MSAILNCQGCGKPVGSAAVTSDKVFGLWHYGCFHCADTITSLRAANAAQAEEIERLRRALGPFAQAYQFALTSGDDTRRPSEYLGGEDYAAAAAALSTPKDPP